MNERDLIRSFVTRAETLDADIDALNADKAELFREAKARRLDVTALKAVIGFRRKRDRMGADVLAQRNDTFETYLHAVESASGTNDATRARAREDGPHKAAPAILPPHDAVTDEIFEDRHIAHPPIAARAEPEIPAFLDRRHQTHGTSA